MSGSLYPVGYGRPPAHTRFQKGQSGNPGGRPGPKKLLKQDFDAALGDALDSDEEVLRNAKPARVIEALARQITLAALEGRPSAQRLVVSLLDRETVGAAAAADEAQRRDEDAPDSLFGAETRRVLGDRFDEFERRYRAAVDMGSVDDLVKLVEDFDGPGKFPQSGNSSGNF
jgi:Family of unknown function (DUF5681)